MELKAKVNILEKVEGLLKDSNTELSDGYVKLMASKIRLQNSEPSRTEIAVRLMLESNTLPSLKNLTVEATAKIIVSQVDALLAELSKPKKT